MHWITLKQARGLLSLSQQELADLADVGVSDVSRIEHGHQLPSYPTLLRVVGALRSRGLVGLSMDDMQFTPSKAERKATSAA